MGLWMPYVMENQVLLVDPDGKEDITEAIKKVIRNKETYIPKQQEILEKFGYVVYKNNMKRLIEEMANLKS